MAKSFLLRPVATGPPATAAPRSSAADAPAAAVTDQGEVRRLDPAHPSKGAPPVSSLGGAAPSGSRRAPSPRAPSLRAPSSEAPSFEAPSFEAPSFEAPGEPLSGSAELLTAHAEDLIARLQWWAEQLDQRESELNAGIARQETRERSFRLWAGQQREQLARLEREALRLREQLKRQARRLALAQG